MTSLILAAGNQARWEKDRSVMSVQFKQLLPVCGEPVLHRIVRQVRERGETPYIVTHLSELWTQNAVHFEPIRRRWTVETFWYSQQLWKNRVIVLLGDTAYSRTVMDRIFSCREPIRVFGNEYEIYAISFNCAEVCTEPNWMLVDAIADARLDALIRDGPGTLRMVYEALCGFELRCGKTESKIMDRVCYIQDYTKDFDTPNDYTNFLNKWERKGLVDDLP